MGSILNVFHSLYKRGGEFNATLTKILELKFEISFAFNFLGEIKDFIEFLGSAIDVISQ